jgi:hypothetical protein
MSEFSDCPGNNGKRIPNNNCSWSHGGFDIGHATAPATAAGPLAAEWVSKGSLMWSPPTGFNNHQGICEYPAGSGLFYMFYHSAWLSGGDGLRRNVCTVLVFRQNVCTRGCHWIPRMFAEALPCV